MLIIIYSTIFNVFFLVIRSTPSAKYEGRSGKGDILAAYGVSENVGIEWKNTGVMPKVCLYEDDGEDSLKKPYKHMFQKLQNKADGNYFLITVFHTQI